MKQTTYIGITSATVSLILGALLGFIVSKFFDGIQIGTVIVAIAVICCFVSSLLILCFVSSMTGLVEKAQRVVDDALKYRAELIPREFVYKEMAKCLRSAEKEVAIITYFMYDWVNKKRTFLPPEQVFEGKEDFYEAVFECIKNPNVEYVRVWQVPSEYKGEALAAIESDPYYKKEVDHIRKISLRTPDLARFVIEDALTTASFILVDRKHLFFNVDFYDKARGLWHSPYMIFVKDATEKAFDGLKSVIVRLTSHYES